MRDAQTGFERDNCDKKGTMTLSGLKHFFRTRTRLTLNCKVEKFPDITYLTSSWLRGAEKTSIVIEYGSRYIKRMDINI